MRGIVQAQVQTGGGLSESGEPIPTSIGWGDEVDCLYVANTKNNYGRYVDGSFTQASYTITTSDLDFRATIVRLTDNLGNELCIKEVQSLELLEAVQRIKITI